MPKNSQLLMNIGHGLTLAIGLPLIASWDSLTRPKKAKRGTFGFNVQTNSLEYWDGIDWFETPLGKL